MQLSPGSAPETTVRPVDGRVRCVACRAALTPHELECYAAGGMNCDVCAGGPICTACYGYPEQDCPLCGMNESAVCGHL